MSSEGNHRKTALITGGSRGIGAATVKRLAAEGCEIVFLYHENDEAAKSLVAELPAASILPIRCDVSDRKSVNMAIQKAGELLSQRRRYGEGTEKDGASEDALCEEDAFDIVVCNAGISVTGLFTDMSLQQWEQLSGVNLDGMVHVLQTILPPMISAHRGSIILVSSMWGRVGASCEAGYSATKAAVQGLGKSLAKELGPSGIRVNCVAPGVIDTDMNRGLGAEEMEVLKEETPLGRIGTPEEVAELIWFLASEKASFITGQIIGVDGGFVI